MNDQLQALLQTSEDYTLAVAEAMPESGYNDAPVDGVWTFKMLLNHIAYGIEWWAENYIRKNETAWTPPPSKENKSTTIQYLKNAYANLRVVVDEEIQSTQSAQGLYATLDHITHHRGQATIHLRSKGVTPPAYNY